MKTPFWRTSSVIGGLALGLLILTRLISELSFWLAEPLYYQWRQLDPDNSFLMITLHHLWQGSIALLVIIVIARNIRLLTSISHSTRCGSRIATSCNSSPA
ncbi:hypothetical protein A6A03_12145 [Chloroflexus islandicus]|uniref:Uncharacterized protein n=1 Tax=Chloroflexus islandicus TaxID=1707952 RepID=A0A178MCR6_9CHLR|nr:hypothetical protein [Chloroflexus islandicus]OAN46542.1 hypothetical protein A6A03_12145 [Chloroflexus islandicus]